MILDTLRLMLHYTVEITYSVLMPQVQILCVMTVQ